MNSTIFSYPLLIKEGHLDTFGHVNNATYLALFEEARWHIVTQNGYGHKKMMETGIGPTILEIKLRFLKELRLREEIIIETWLASYTGKVGKLNQRMMRGEEECCIAEITIALFSLKERKIILPTQDWLSAIGKNNEVA